ncbi:RNA binding protein fox-1 homolog 1-like isoform X1 [Polyodon spathula]|nr:RNA binding protein fox-1 homolog 1-like isoform X1 [Polyodon spathula]
MLSSQAVVLHPYGLPVYPQPPSCYSGLVQGAPPGSDGGSSSADPSLTTAYGPPPAYPPAQAPPTMQGPRLPMEFSPAHPSVLGVEFQEHGLRMYQPGPPPSLPEQNTDTNPPSNTQQEDSAQLDLSQNAAGQEDDSSKPQPKRLHVSNIPFRFRDPDLRQMFGQFGKILDVEIIFNERGSKGFGFVTFESSLEADSARDKLNGTIVEGRKIEVNNATARVVTKKPQPPLINAGWKINPMVGAVYAPELFTMASFPYPVAPPTLAYRGAALRGRGRAVYNTIRSATGATPTPVPAYPGLVYQDGLYGAEVYGGYPAYRVAQPASATTTYSDGYGRVYTTAPDPYHHTVGPTATYGVSTVASLYRGGYNRFTPY